MDHLLHPHRKGLKKKVSKSIHSHLFPYFQNYISPIASFLLVVVLGLQPSSSEIVSPKSPHKQQPIFKQNVVHIM